MTPPRSYSGREKKKKSTTIQMCHFKLLQLKQVSHKAVSEPGVPLCSLQEACDMMVGGCHTITY